MSITAKSYVPRVTFFLSSLSLSRFLSSSSYGSINCTVLIVMLVLPFDTRLLNVVQSVRGMYLVCMYEC